MRGIKKKAKSQQGAKSILLKLALCIALLPFGKAGMGQYVQPMSYKDYSFPWQVNIGNGSLKVTDPSAYLEVGNAASTKGFLNPRGNKASVSGPSAGLQFYDASTAKPWWWNGSAWVTWSDAAAAAVTSITKSNDTVYYVINGVTQWFTTGAGSSTTVNSFNGRTGIVIPQSGDYFFSQISGKPTTLGIGGYGITDAYTQTQVNALLAARLASTDTTNMLLTYKHWLENYLKAPDTLSLSARIDAINTSTTPLIFSNGLEKDLLGNVRAQYFSPIWNANRIQSYYVDATTPMNGAFMGFDSTIGRIKWMKVDSVFGGGAGSALSRFGVIGEDKTATQNRIFSGSDTYTMWFDSLASFKVNAATTQITAKAYGILTNDFNQVNNDDPGQNMYSYGGASDGMIGLTYLNDSWKVKMFASTAGVAEGRSNLFEMDRDSIVFNRSISGNQTPFSNPMNFRIRTLPNKTPVSTDSTLVVDGEGRFWKAPYSAGGGSGSKFGFAGEDEAITNNTTRSFDLANRAFSLWSSIYTNQEFYFGQGSFLAKLENYGGAAKAQIISNVSNLHPDNNIKLYSYHNGQDYNGGPSDIAETFLNVMADSIQLSQKSNGGLNQLAGGFAAGKALTTDDLGNLRLYTPSGGSSTLAAGQIAFGSSGNVMTSSAELKWNEASGGTLTIGPGNLDASLVIDGSTGGNDLMYFKEAGITRWDFGKIGANMAIARYNSSGVYQNEPFKIDGADGTIKLGSYNTSVSGTAAYGLAVDATGKMITTALSGGATAPAGAFGALQLNRNNLFSAASADSLMYTTAGGLSVKNSMSIAAAQKLYLDGGGDTYIREADANNLEFFVGGSQVIVLNGNSFTVGSSMQMKVTNYTPTSSSDATYFNGTFTFDDNYLYHRAAGVWKRIAFTSF